MWKKQNISEFKRASKRLKVLFIEKHFKPSCRRKRLQPTQPKFEGDDRRMDLCGVFRVVRNFTKSTMFPLFSLLEWRNWALHLRTMLSDSESRRKFRKLRLDAHSIPNYVIKDAAMVLDLAKPINWKIPYSLDCAEEKLQESLFSRWTFWKDSRRFLRDPVYRESQLAFGRTEQV